MLRHPRFLAEVSWFQVVASVLAAVTSAWIASRLGVAGTVVGAALGSFVVTISTAFYGRTLHQGKTLLVTTASGTVIQRRVEDDQIAETIEQAEELDSPVVSGQVVADGPQRLHWKTIIATTVAVLVLALAAISTYELIAGHTLDGSGGTTIGDTFGGSKGKPKPTETTPSATTPTRTASTGRPTPSPTDSAPTPTGSPSTPTAPPSGTPIPSETPVE